MDFVLGTVTIIIKIPASPSGCYNRMYYGLFTIIKGVLTMKLMSTLIVAIFAIVSFSAVAAIGTNQNFASATATTAASQPKPAQPAKKQKKTKNLEGQTDAAE